MEMCQEVYRCGCFFFFLMSLYSSTFPKRLCIDQRFSTFSPLFFPRRHPSPKLYGMPRDSQPGEQWAAAACPGLTPWPCLQDPLFSDSTLADCSRTSAHFFPITFLENQSSPAQSLSCCFFYPRPFHISLSPASITVLSKQ